MFSIGNDLLVKLIYMNLLLSVGRLQQVDEVVKELFAEVIYVFLWIIANQEHLPNMSLTLYMAIRLQLADSSSLFLFVIWDLTI